MTATVNLHLDASAAEVYSLVIERSGERFISIAIGGVTLILHGYDAAAATIARDLAAKLMACADEVDRLRPIEAAIARLEPPGPVKQMTNSGEIGTGTYHKDSAVSQ